MVAALRPTCPLTPLDRFTCCPRRRLPRLDGLPLRALLPPLRVFGVDLIADAHRQLHVIEVNIAPDLTLSTEGACAATAHGCVGGSSIYDHTKRAAAYSSVRPSAAADRGRRVGARLGVGVGAREGVRVRVGPRGDEG